MNCRVLTCYEWLNGSLISRPCHFPVDTQWRSVRTRDLTEAYPVSYQDGPDQNQRITGLCLGKSAFSPTMSDIDSGCCLILSPGLVGRKEGNLGSQVSCCFWYPTSFYLICFSRDSLELGCPLEICSGAPHILYIRGEPE